jgi:hypothetical protein
MTADKKEVIYCLPSILSTLNIELDIQDTSGGDYKITGRSITPIERRKLWKTGKGEVVLSQGDKILRKRQKQR